MLSENEMPMQNSINVIRCRRGSDRKFGKFGHPLVTLIYSAIMKLNDEDDQVPHRTQFRTKGYHRPDDRCEPSRLQQYAHSLQDPLRENKGTSVGIRYEQDRNEDET